MIYSSYGLTISLSNRHRRHSLYPRNNKNHLVYITLFNHYYNPYYMLGLNAKRSNFLWFIASTLNIQYYIRITCVPKSTREPVLYIIYHRFVYMLVEKEQQYTER